MSKKMVTKSNALIESAYRLTLTEMQIVLYGISLINPLQKNFPLSYRIDIKRFADLFNRDHGQIYQKVKETVFKRFWERDFSYKNDKGKIITIRWLSKIIHQDKTGYIEIKFSEELQPYLHQLHGQFTTYYIDKIINFKSVYSVRFYEYAIMNLNKSFSNQCKLKVLVEEIKERLKLNEKYTRFSNFKLFVLEPAKKEINKYSDIKLIYKVIKLGRSPHEIEFTISKKIPCKKQLAKKSKDYLSPGIIEKGKKIAIEAGTDWDIYAIEQEFYDYAKKAGAPNKLEGAFLGFVKTKVAKIPQ